VKRGAGSGERGAVTGTEALLAICSIGIYVLNYILSCVNCGTYDETAYVCLRGTGGVVGAVVQRLSVVSCVTPISKNLDRRGWDRKIRSSLGDLRILRIMVCLDFPWDLTYS
jgi:hypothetical protein